MGIEDVLEQNARKHVGVAAGVGASGETRTLGRGRIADDAADRAGRRHDLEIGPITKVVTATVLER
jgi:hypothetical protein